ncbi:hypothetical protein MNBD_IGNAVI01-1365 [hydrothermal vent metagenome]|uniref:Uncharacterized protein n=1 Tax=hydrothermal vent metagenome TaxID=652676 RepID=A0A3B1C235_9ZZZZ
MERKKTYYLIPILLGVILFASNFLSTDIFNNSTLSFTVWFVLSVFTFACGWFVDRTLGWNYGGKIVFAVIVASVIVSVFMVGLFGNYFGVNNLITENLILYSLRNIVLGSMALFGMSVSEVAHLRLGFIEQEEEEEIEEVERTFDVDDKAELILTEARLKAEQMVFDAEKKVEELSQQKKHVEVQLKEFIQVERDIIHQYESDDK